MSLTNLRQSKGDRSKLIRSQMHSKSSLSLHRSTMSKFNRTSASGFQNTSPSQLGPSFVFKSFDVPTEEKKTIDYDRLLKLPHHKPKIMKFDKTSVDQERTVTILTKEDNFDKFDMPWISRLRIKDNAEMIRIYSKKKFEQTVPAPPSFYENDLHKAGKFTHHHNVDFDFNGNTSVFEHLMKHKATGAPTNSEINFGYALRTYKSETGFKTEKPFLFPGVQESKKLFGLPQFSGHQTRRNITTKNSKIKLAFDDKFPQKNTNNIRHMFNNVAQIGTVKWGASLRWPDDSHKFTKRITTSPHKE